MRLLFAALLGAALVGCTAETSTETSITNPDGSKTTTRTETKNVNGVSTTRKTETVTKGGQTTKTVYEKKGDEWVKVE
jgi:hypothetical protein